eukprot:TRINITY_DN13664_c1_g1_i1.p1 TRINITY_DN13664_c1_g1~~TRINITY_DN13664_c1_g1_i1.p1  ORF type:complete len:695 (+),score=88.87 TRINITY_DN13664_c1_g1_i1:70-2085(+)
MAWITKEQLSEHGKESGTPWVAIGGYVYEMKDLMRHHPGGMEPLLRHAGGDGTTLFEKAGHSEAAKQALGQYFLGPLSEPEQLNKDEDATPAFTVGSYAEAIGLRAPGNCNGWRGKLVAHQTTPTGKPGAVVVFPAPFYQQHLCLSNLKLPDPNEKATFTITKKQDESLGICHRGGTVIIGGVPGNHLGESTFSKYAGRWLIAVNNEETQETHGFGVHDHTDLTEVKIEIGGMVPVKGDRLTLTANNVRATCLGMTDVGRVSAQPDDGTPVQYLSREMYILDVTPDTPDSPAVWHSNRRSAILHDHPEIENLPKHEPLSLLIGVTTFFVHLFTGCAASECSFLTVFLLAYTVGALCKTLQFAIGHEICHNAVSSWVSQPNVKLPVLQFCTLPSMGCGLFNYYAHHHLGHHALLGSQGFKEAADAFLEGREVDGDLLHSYTAQLRGKVMDLTVTGSFVPRKPMDGVPSLVRPFLVLLRDSTIHIGHLMLIMFWTGMSGLLYISAFVMTCGRGMDRVPGVMGKPREMLEIGKQSFFMLFLVLFMGRGGIYQLLNVCLYLGLSEMFLAGFGLHPMGAYFLGVHKTAPGVAGNIEHNRPCQPTQSCYASPVFSFLTLNLTYHTEHHDFPNLPWSALPKLREIAPEYYRCLASLPHPLVTIYKYVFASEHWAYGCT